MPNGATKTTNDYIIEYNTDSSQYVETSSATTIANPNHTSVRQDVTNDYYYNDGTFVTVSDGYSSTHSQGGTNPNGIYHDSTQGRSEGTLTSSSDGVLVEDYYSYSNGHGSYSTNHVGYGGVYEQTEAVSGYELLGNYNYSQTEQGSNYVQHNIINGENTIYHENTYSGDLII